MLTFIDLFAGIGGFRIALENLGCKCVFSSEIDSYSRKVYLENFGHLPENDDIRQLDENVVPNHDILCAGFPCQAFSIAGRKNGFEDARGTLFFEIARIINVKKPKAFLLENVQGLLTHNKGKTLRTILDILENDLQYFVPSPKILNARNFGVPQNRPRIFIVGFRKDLNIFNFSYPKSIGKIVLIKDILEKTEVSVKYYLSEQYLGTLVKHRERHQNKGNGFGYEIIKPDGVANSLVVGGMGKERNLVVDERLTNFIPVTRIKGEVNKSKVRRMTPREWARLQGFPESFKIVVSDVQAYKQFGNSVAIPVVEAVAEQIIKTLTLSLQEKKQITSSVL
ncbi:DNA (cytosine-5-)-methyltransferase [Aphanothece hegewaldii CCALA 016]|uniref:Cytosine-specific methyltransferase n=1 Tax=Aphanothece hegewaldii CCALA 016 TaxID=2107694 RepID=A0A2T1LZ81_9CHRO|nr:DNA cytosine methyltransferase [Aphanothece hegewaldii]PSF37714.1 DNA (cytosine-5-)-methyltransferase [Aphanothece hegewaldii CCALA 016]